MKLHQRIRANCGLYKPPLGRALDETMPQGIARWKEFSFNIALKEMTHVTRDMLCDTGLDYLGAHLTAKERRTTEGCELQLFVSQSEKRLKSWESNPTTARLSELTGTEWKTTPRQVASVAGRILWR